LHAKNIIYNTLVTALNSLTLTPYSSSPHLTTAYHTTTITLPLSRYHYHATLSRYQYHATTITLPISRYQYHATTITLPLSRYHYHPALSHVAPSHSSLTPSHLTPSHLTPSILSPLTTISLLLSPLTQSHLLSLLHSHSCSPHLQRRHNTRSKDIRGSVGKNSNSPRRPMPRHSYHPTLIHRSQVHSHRKLHSRSLTRSLQSPAFSRFERCELSTISRVDSSCC
jgi:hypothetical protein